MCMRSMCNSSTYCCTVDKYFANQENPVQWVSSTCHANVLLTSYSILLFLFFSLKKTSNYRMNWTCWWRDYRYVSLIDIDRDGHEISRFGGLPTCQESYIFPRDYIFPNCAALRENIVPTLLFSRLYCPDFKKIWAAWSYMLSLSLIRV